MQNVIFILQFLSICLGNMDLRNAHKNLTRLTHAKSLYKFNRIEVFFSTSLKPPKRWQSLDRILSFGPDQVKTHDVVRLWEASQYNHIPPYFTGRVKSVMANRCEVSYLKVSQPQRAFATRVLAVHTNRIAIVLNCHDPINPPQ